MEQNDKRQELLNLTRALIKFRTTYTRPEEQKSCADFIENYFANTSYSVKRFFHEGVHSLFISRNTKTPKVLLCAHFDVVEADDTDFSPVEKDGKLYGRGSMDMKSGLAVLMTTMKDLDNTNSDVGLLITGDEERGGFAGTAHVLSLGYSCQVAVIPDGGFAVQKLVEKEKGILQIKLTAHGSSAHGSKPWDGDNAILKLYEAFDAIHSLFPTPQDASWVTTCNIGKISGGHATNQVPSEATAHLDIRYTESYTSESLLEKIRRALPANISMDIEMNEPLCTTDLNHPLVRPFAESLAVIGRKPEVTVDHGASDGRFFSSLGIPVIISQPDGAGLHGQNEWVDIQSIEDYYKALLDYLKKVALFTNTLQ